jgi:NADPH2:quinone reductase
MKTMLSKQTGGPETLVLEDVPSPVARAGEVVVSVKACGVNYPDVLMIEDRYQSKPRRPFAPGGEISGIVKSVGEGVTNVKPGDRVLGSTGNGGMSEEVAVNAEKVIKIADSMPFDEAAAFVFTYGTSHHALKDRGHLKPGDTLLVLGAAGGVGLAAVELGKTMGAKVVACSTQEKVDLAVKHGADRGVVYPAGALDRDQQKQLSEAFKDACGPDGADVIYDGVGGDYAEPALRSIAWDGRYLVVGFPAGIPKIPLNLPLLKNCHIVGVFWGAWSARNPDQNQANLDELMALHAAGKVKPFVSERFPLARAGEAIAHLANRKALGKVVVTMD